MILKRSVLAVVAACSFGAAPLHAAPSDLPCMAPDDAAGAITALPQVAEVLKPGSTLNILAVGSATLFGPEASFPQGAAPGKNPPQIITSEPSQLAFPQQMVEALRAAVPGATVTMTVRGGRGLSAADMLDLIRSELKSQTFQLVLWQTGTVEAVHNTPPGDFTQTLVDGADIIKQSGADLVLVDPQFSRFLQTNSNLDPYEQAMQQVAAMPDVMLFRRFDLMKAWSNEGTIDLERTPKGERKRTVEALHACLGTHLARMVLNGARS